MLRRISRTWKAADPFGVLTSFMAQGRDLEHYVAPARAQTDDRLALEYSAPRAIYGRYQTSNVDRLRATAAHATLPPAIDALRACDGNELASAR